MKNKNMKMKFIKVLILSSVVIIALSGFGGVVFAADPPLSVTFSPNPLFEALNFVPGDSVKASVTISNSDTTTRSAYIEAVNVLNSDNLASQMKLEMFDGLTQIYDDNFGTFLSAGPVALSSIDVSGSKIYNLKITFLENSTDAYQGKTLKFDICVGFSGGEERCTNEIVVSPENNTGSGSSSSGGGGSSGGSHLLIFNERNSVPAPNTTTATVHWETNKPSTSQVIYGPAENEYALDLSALPFFGYPSGTSENLIKVLNHTEILSGLVPGQTYKYRVVSRASPPTISYEHEFTVPTFYQNSGVITAGSLGFSGEGEILGASVEDDEKITNVTSTRNENNLAAAFASSWQDLLSWWWLLLLLLIVFFIWRAYIYKKE